MSRTQPPRGRAAGVALCTAVLSTLLVAVPASAAGDLTMTASERVTGRDFLVLTLDGLAELVPLAVELTDADGDVGLWRYPAVEAGDGGSVSVDLSAPDDGAAPGNGPATIRISSAGRLASATTIVDRTPPVPTPRSVVRGQRVSLTWNAVAAAGPVTYKLERIRSGESWTVVQEGRSADGYTDRDLEPSRYRYRLSAALPSADEGLNWSALSAVQVKIAAPPPPPSHSPTPAEPAAQPTADDAPTAPAAPKREGKRDQERPRDVSATGQVRGAVAGDGAAPKMQPRPAPLLSTADEPAADGDAPPLTSDQPPVAPPDVADPLPTPEVAAPRAASPAVNPFPVTVPPAGTLAVEAATHLPPDPVTLLTGSAFLLLSLGVLLRLRGRPGLRVIQSWVGRRSARTPLGGPSRRHGPRYARSTGRSTPG